ncbi:MAG: hypothetical protein KKD47_12515 [Proteobacteria bacterium]|nr:hypothetical protein [Pseudomonadota bacterium]
MGAADRSYSIVSIKECPGIELLKGVRGGKTVYKKLRTDEFFDRKDPLFIKPSKLLIFLLEHQGLAYG